MALAAGTAGSSFRSAICLAVVLAALPASAQVGPREREDILRLAQSRGGAEADIVPLVQEVDRAVVQGLPQSPLVNKVKEGLSKGVAPARVHLVLKDLVGNMVSAREILGSAPNSSMVLLAESLGRGVTRSEFDELRRLSGARGAAPAPEDLALGAKCWAVLREAGFSSREALPLVAEAIQQKFRSAEFTTLAREVARRRETLTTGDGLERVTESVQRGERPERLFPSDANTRPERRGVDRPPAERPSTPERPQPERPPTDRPKPERQRPGQ